MRHFGIDEQTSSRSAHGILLKCAEFEVGPTGPLNARYFMGAVGGWE